MAFLSRILAPVEFSERCARAVRYASSLAGHFQAELLVIHVLPPEAPGISDELYAQAAAKAKQKLDDFLSTELAGFAVRRTLLKGDPARKIVQYALDERADIILMPTRGLGPFRRFLLGSNTAKVLHDADCPVWTGVHEEPGAAASVPIRRVLCAVDLGPLSANVLTWAAAVQREFDARLSLLHAAFPAPRPEGDSRWDVMAQAAAETELQQLRCESGVEADLVVETGESAHVISAAADRLQADVLVIGRGSAGPKGQPAFGRLRANAYAIIRQSPCPVVSV